MIPLSTCSQCGEYPVTVAIVHDRKRKMDHWLCYFCLRDLLRPKKVK